MCYLEEEIMVPSLMVAVAEAGARGWLPVERMDVIYFTNAIHYLQASFHSYYAGEDDGIMDEIATQYVSLLPSILSIKFVHCAG